MTSPQVWFHSCVALMYVVDAFLVCLTVLYCWRAMNRGGTWLDAVVIGGLLCAARRCAPADCTGLGTVAVLHVLEFQPGPRRKTGRDGARGGRGCTAWLLPMVEMSGGCHLI